MPMAFNSIYRLALQTNINGVTCINTMHFKQTGLQLNGAQTLAENFNTRMTTSWRGCSGNNVLFQTITVVDVVPYHTEAGTYTYAANTFGTEVSSAGAPCLARVLTLYGDAPTRRKRGRLFVAGARSGADQTGTWNAATLTSIGTMATTLAAQYVAAAGIESNAYQLGIWSRATGGTVPPFNSNGFTPCVSITVRTTVRVQRRREIGVGL